ncbi:MAG: tRNA preQ1(34) S-adenosylmethionine ribosyltransferase-isomerase QueA, partial [Spirochaetota bacterium]
MNHGKRQYTLSDFFFDLPDRLIAQTPADRRDSSRLFVFPRDGSEYKHDMFRNLTEYLCPGDLLVFNDARVIHARLFFRRKSGAEVEVVLARMIDESNWLAITNRTKRLKDGEELISAADETVAITVLRREGEYIRIQSHVPLNDTILRRIGSVPLPPYIRRKPDKRDEERYQTVYARSDGAVAAPTAGLHFTGELLERMRAAGVLSCSLTLYVSWGTFSPVRHEKLSRHTMHTESYVLPQKSANMINTARQNGNRVIAVGTTSLRVLETTYNGRENRPGSGETSIFIYPPHDVRSIDGIITNFHTPGSTLLMLICAFA